MKKYFLYLTISLIISLISTSSFSQEQNHKSDTAFIIIDIQDFYFPGGILPLFEPEKAALNAQKVLNVCRENNILVVHVRHNASSGAEINDLVKPLENEKIISKDKANAFVNTDLLEYLKENNIHNLLLCGMQTHMCLEAATRAASDYGFNCTVIEDACTTRDLKYNDIVIAAKDVHYSTLNTLKGTYAKIINTEDFLKEYKY